MMFIDCSRGGGAGYGRGGEICWFGGGEGENNKVLVLD